MRRLPLSLTAMAAITIAAVLAIGYTLQKLQVRLPFDDEQFTLHVELADAQGLDEADHPLAGVAGTRQGRVERVRYRDGRAVATLKLDPGVRGKIFRDATVAVRPAGAIPVLTVNVLPGTPAAGTLADGATIAAERASTYVAADRLLGVFDADTRAHLQVLVGQSDVALRGRGGELADAVRRIAPLAVTGRRVAAAVAQRRTQLRELVGHSSRIATALGDSERDLGTVLDGAARILKVAAGRSAELDATLRGLPATVLAARSAVRDTRALATPLVAGVDAARPALRASAPALRRLRGLTPEASGLLRDLLALQRRGAPQLRSLRGFTKRLQAAATDAGPAVEAAAKTTTVLSDYGPGVAQLGDVISGAVSTNDANGVLSRAIFTAVEPPKPENLGLPAAAARRGRDGGPSRMSAMLARALERTCRTNELACLMRVLTPGLPAITEARR